MKVLIVTSDFLDEIGGIAQHVDNLSRVLATRAQVAIVYLSRSEHTESYVDDHGRSIFRIPNPGSKWKRIWRFPHTRVGEIISEFNPDVIHVHTIFEALAWHPPDSIATVYTNHCSTYLRLYRWPPLRPVLLRSMLAKFRAVIAPSTELAEKSQHQYATMIPNGVDCKQFSAQLRPETACDEVLANQFGVERSGRQIVLSARRLVAKNGIAEFLRVNARLLKSHADEWMYLIAGDGPERRAIQDIVESEQLSNVQLLGGISHAQIHHLYHAADLCVLPSRMEAISITALEAMASGCVAVVSPVGGLAELVIDGETGIVLPESLRLDHALDLPLEERTRIAGDAFALVERDYSWEQVAEQTLHVYGKVAHPSLSQNTHS